jgi:hypothetical protein
MTYSVTPLLTPLAKPERFLPTAKTACARPALFARRRPHTRSDYSRSAGD